MTESQDYMVKTLELVTSKTLGQCGDYSSQVDKELAKHGFTHISGDTIPVRITRRTNPESNAVIREFLNTSIGGMPPYRTGVLYIATGPKDLVDKAIESIRSLSKREGWKDCSRESVL